MNDTDELTMVTACLNEEFFRIGQEEAKAEITRVTPQENEWDLSERYGNELSIDKVNIRQSI